MMVMAMMDLELLDHCVIINFISMRKEKLHKLNLYKILKRQVLKLNSFQN